MWYDCFRLAAVYSLFGDALRNRSTFWPLRLFSLIPIVIAIVLFAMQVERFNRSRDLYPNGLIVAGLPVGGLDREAAGERLQQVYATPVELSYDGALIHLYPAEAGFRLHLDEMLDAADREASKQPYWEAFRDSLLGRSSNLREVPLGSSHSPDLLRQFLLREVAERYDRPPSPATPYPGTVQFTPGSLGTVLDVETSMPPIEKALLSPVDRQVELPLVTAEPPRPPIRTLDVLLRQTLTLNRYDGLLGLYVLDLQTGDEVHLVYRQGEFLSTDPDAAFTASSTIKIPIMVSVFRYLADNPDPNVVDMLERMIGYSDNEATDWLVQRTMDPFFGPLQVTDDIVTMGMKNTFWAGYFARGSPLLRRYDTPANMRTDLYSILDPYNQTTPSEMGMLLGDIYQCAKHGGGALVAIFPGQISQAECQSMIDYLIMDRIPLLIAYGVPEGTPVAHKHGWISSASTGVIHDISDAGIVFTPGGDFVLAIYLYHPVQLVFDPNNELIAELSRAVYNFFNPPLP